MMAITLSSQMMMTYTSYSLPVNQKQTNAHEVRGHSLVGKDLLHFKIVTKIMFAEKKKYCHKSEVPLIQSINKMIFI